MSSGVESGPCCLPEPLQMLHTADAGSPGAQAAGGDQQQGGAATAAANASGNSSASRPGARASDDTATAAAVDGSAPAPDGSRLQHSGASAAERDLLSDGNAAAAQAWLLNHCRVSVVSLGARGCVARAADGSSTAAVADK